MYSKTTVVYVVTPPPASAVSSCPCKLHSHCIQKSSCGDHATLSIFVINFIVVILYENTASESVSDTVVLSALKDNYILVQ